MGPVETSRPEPIYADGENDTDKSVGVLESYLLHPQDLSLSTESDMFPAIYDAMNYSFVPGPDI